MKLCSALVKVAGLAGLFACWLTPVYGQLTFFDDRVAVHGSLSEGFLYSTGNNYLTAMTNSGSFDFTDASVQISAKINKNLRVGAQAYVRKVGKIGAGHVVLDWALVDYRFNDYIGIRAGKVKTVFGLYTDTQDLEFLHTWALLPQAIYPIDLRGVTIAHTGGDIYGSVSPEHLGTFSYTAYAGFVPQDLAGGYQYDAVTEGLLFHAVHGHSEGADVKWNTPIDGLLLGASARSSPHTFPGVNIPLLQPASTGVRDHSYIFSAQYIRGNWHFDSEYYRETYDATAFNSAGPYGPPVVTVALSGKGAYGSAAYRVNKRLELGEYTGDFLPVASFVPDPIPSAQRHVFDQAISARFDLTRFWDLKIEGHFINGYGVPGVFRGFYPQENPNGFVTQTNLLIVRVGFSL